VWSCIGRVRGKGSGEAKEWFPGAEAWPAAARRSGSEWFEVGEGVVDGGPGPAVENWSLVEEAEVEEQMSAKVKKEIGAADSPIEAAVAATPASDDQLTAPSSPEQPIVPLRFSEPPRLIRRETAGRVKRLTGIFEKINLKF
jgi:hypothetical protein